MPYYCGFCGKLCETPHGLKRHIDRTPDCKKASHEEFGQYANSIWDNVPENQENVEQQPPMLPIEPADMPDFYLDEDILDEDIRIAEENIQPPLQQQLDEPQPWPQHATVDIPVNKVNMEGALYFEYFPEEHMAGATWGRCKPLFESIVEEQKNLGGSRWAPFEDEEEWQLAEWLIQNVGQKQTDAFLKLCIVSFSSCFREYNSS
jgi:hypothetical protein